jgi:uncharacterized protein DUF6044
VSPALRLLALLVGLTVAVTFPQAIHLGTGVHDFGDPLLNAWALAWTPHALVTAPLSLFDANIFFPERTTLALSETLVFPALLTAPLRAAGANAIVLHNLTLLSGYVLSGLTMFLLVKSVTGDARAAVLAAVAFAISPLRAEHYPRVQQQLTYLMPLALYFVHRIVDGAAGTRTSVLLGLTCGGLFYSCVYYWIFFVTLLPLLIAGLLIARRRMTWDIARALALAVIVAAAAIAPAVPAYLRNRHAVGERQVAELARGSAELRDYRRPTPGNLLYGGTLGGPPERHLFTGYVLPVVATSVILSPAGQWLPYAAAVAVSVDLSLGLNGRCYAWLYEHALPYRALRVPARFAVVANMFLAVLAGMGCAQIMRRLSSERQRTLLLVALAGGVAVESLNRPIELRDMPTRTPAVYAWVRASADGPILEYPAGNLEGRIGPQDATYMYYSTNHWRPLLNGYSGFAPPSYLELLDRLRDFPASPSIAYVRQRGARYLLVHERYYLNGGFDGDIAALRGRADLRERAMFVDPVLGRTYVYELTR